MAYLLSPATATRPTPHQVQIFWALRLLATLRLWQQRIRSRRQLAWLDERLLADSGISSAERQIELEKPFWR